MVKKTKMGIQNLAHISVRNVHLRGDRALVFYIRVTRNNYLHYHLFDGVKMGGKNLKKKKKNASWSLYGGIFKLLLLSDQQSKTQIFTLLTYNL